MLVFSALWMLPFAVQSSDFSGLFLWESDRLVFRIFEEILVAVAGFAFERVHYLAGCCYCSEKIDRISKIVSV